MKKKQKAALAVAALEKEYPDALCSLEEKEPYRLLIAVRLSAQCTDARVNLVTPVLFERFPTLESLAFADVAEVEEIVHPCGFFRAKANDIVSMSRMLIEKYDSKVPVDREVLQTFPGVGRKTANVFLSEYYNYPAIAVDTHVERVSKRLKIAKKEDDVQTIENKLMKFYPKQDWAKRHLQMVLFGRYHCKAIKPNCSECKLKSICINKLKTTR